MQNNSMISIRPDYELATRYGASWQTQILNAAENVGLPTIDLYGAEATSTNFFSSLETQDPLIVNIFGHGNYNIIVCQNEECLLEGCMNDEILSGRVVYDLSCRSGRDLASSAVSKGAVSFLGYDDDFIFIITEGMHSDGGMLNPLEDEVARGFFESHNASIISYINGASLINSYWISQDIFNYWIKIWNEIDSQVAGFLMWDRDHQIMKPLISVMRPKLGLAPLMTAFIPLLIIPFAKHLKKIKNL